MKKMDDDELQNWLDQNRDSILNDDLPSGDTKAYSMLFDALETEPSEGLPFDFAAKVTRKVIAEKKRSSELKYYLTGLAVLIVFIAVVYDLLTTVKGGTATIYIDAILKYKWAFVFGIFSFLTVQYLDVVLVKAKVFKR